ncbi:MAG TPA: ATP synthase F1 subunit epsilon [Aggregatilineaceae bacterium]|nr:ATP synthase F1 subunit epsilon [Aggregatilineaceae bacterium]
MPLEVEVVSRVRKLYHTDKATMVIIPGSEGEMGVLPHHTPLLTTLAYGELRIIEDGDVVSFVVYGGVVDVRPDKVIVLAEDAESATEISQDEINAARDRAQQLMSEHPTPEQRAEIQQELRRAEIMARVQNRLGAERHRIRTVDDDH